MRGITSLSRVVVAALGLVSLYFLLDQPIPDPAPTGAARKVAPLQGAPAPTGISHAATLTKHDDAEPVPAAKEPSPALPGNAAVATRYTPVPYKYLGRSGQGADAVPMLYGYGRLVLVHGPGPLDDEYVVDMVLERHLIIRHATRGDSHLIDLALRTAPPTSNPSDGWPAQD
jgi:hypothetical protein